MAKGKTSEVTSKRVATAASKILSNPKSSRMAKTVAGSALTQRPAARGNKRGR